MKKGLFLQSLVCLLVMSCSIQELDTQDKGTSSKDVFYAYLESYAGPDTKVYVDENIKMHWDTGDLISIFNESTLNQEYRFKGNTGDYAGEFDKVSDPFGTGNDLKYVCAVYPYNSSAKINNNDVLTLTLPAEQAYRNDSFGPGANTMVSVIKKGNSLTFKNVGGYLVLKFYGEGISISSIKLEGNNDEKLSGKATMTPVIGEIPLITMSSTAGTAIVLNCENPVDVGTTKEEATMFWMVVPPTTFSKGFKLTVTGSDGKEFIKETDKNLSIVRNTLLRIAPIEVTFN